MISSHVLDTAAGTPASGVAVHLDVLDERGEWRRLASAKTDDDGRVRALASAADVSGRTCRLTFETGPYLEARGDRAFFPRVDVVFAASPEVTRYHIPLLLSPYGYSTYRGS